MNADEKSLPWWKSDRFFNSVFPALLVALLIYSLVRADQQFTGLNAKFETQNAKFESQFAAQTARIDHIFSELSDIKNEMVDLKKEIVDIKADQAADRERLKRIEDMLRILIDNREDRIREQAQLSQ